MQVYIGAEHIISPLGNTIEENFKNVSKNISGITLQKEAGFNKENVYLSKFKESKSFLSLLKNCIDSILEKVDSTIISSEETFVIISSTKGEINETIENALTIPLLKLKEKYHLAHEPLLISNACISGVMALNTANDLIKAGLYKNCIVIGADVVSNFVLFGFQSLYAISDEPGKPFDKYRKGISLGEGGAGVVMSCNESIFKEKPLKFLGGSSANDANHISGPSRTGEGLYRTIQKTMKEANINEKDIDFISAHGTATLYNDEMESIAFDRLKMNSIPLNSLKGYYGHTLGAAGLIEMAISMQSMRHNILFKSLGFEEQGTSCVLNMLIKNKNQEVNILLKTASGFGGCNASAILKK